MELSAAVDKAWIPIDPAAIYLLGSLKSAFPKNRSNLRVKIRISRMQKASAIHRSRSSPYCVKPRFISACWTYIRSDPNNEGTSTRFVNGSEIIAKRVTDRRSCRGPTALHCTRQSLGERLHRIIQWIASWWVAERRDLLFFDGGIGNDWDMEEDLQYSSTTSFTGLSPPVPVAILVPATQIQVIELW